MKGGFIDSCILHLVTMEIVLIWENFGRDQVETDFDDEKLIHRVVVLSFITIGTILTIIKHKSEKNKLS